MYHRRDHIDGRVHAEPSNRQLGSHRRNAPDWSSSASAVERKHPRKTRCTRKLGAHEFERMGCTGIGWMLYPTIGWVHGTHRLVHCISLQQLIGGILVPNSCVGGLSAKSDTGETGGATVIAAMAADTMPMMTKILTKPGETRSGSSNHGDWTLPRGSYSLNRI